MGKLTSEQAGRPAMAEFRARGPVTASVSGRMVDLGAPKQRTLLALLVSQAGRTVTTDVILEALWEGNPPPSAMTSLQAYVAKLRKVLEPGRAPGTQATVLRTCARGYVLDAGAGALVVMLDHVHRADPASLRMLAHPAKSVPGSRLLLIASYRSDEAPIPTGALGTPSGAEPARMELRGLTPRDTRVLAGAIVGGEVSRRTAEGLCARSAVLDNAIAAGLLDEDEQRLGSFRLTDALVAEALYETTGRMRRGRLRLRIEAAAGCARATERAAAGPAPAATARGHEFAGPGPAGGAMKVTATGGRRGRGVERRTPSRRQPVGKLQPSRMADAEARQPRRGVDFARLEGNVP